VSGHVLDRDAGCERAAAQRISAREADADRQAFGQVVQRNREHEQPSATQHLCVSALQALDEMLVRQHAVQHQQRGRERSHRAAGQGLQHHRPAGHELPELRAQHQQAGQHDRDADELPQWQHGTLGGADEG